ncbi:type II toxin-antitoxin system YhaV family toxin [Methylobacterium sp. JK268]
MERPLTGPAARKHWFRAEFGNGRFRVLFRHDSKAKIIIFAWVNDGNTLRTCGAQSDADHVFEEMLNKGNPPDDRAALLAASSGKGDGERLEKATGREGRACARAGSSR